MRMKSIRLISSGFALLILLSHISLVFTVPGDSVSDEQTNEDGFKPRIFRDYYLQAEKIEWDYLPQQKNLVGFFEEYLNDSLINKANRVGSKYSKYVYKLYTDATYSTEIPTPRTFGYVGPLMRGEVGEIMRIHFRNAIDIPVSVHPHGVRYQKSQEGALYNDHTANGSKADDSIQPGTSYTYIWELTSDFSPRDDDPTCIPFAYHSHHNPDMEVNSGLLGLLLVCKHGILDADGKRSDVNKENVLYFDSINEGNSLLLDENLQRCGDPDECKRLLESGDPDFEESLKKDSINGYMYGNMPPIEVCAGEKIAWYIFSLSAELHPVNIHGQTFTSSGHRSGVIGIWSATFREAEMVATNPGRWLVQCMNSEHNRNGMSAYLVVHDCGNYTLSEQLNNKIRNFYMAAEELEWDYAPSGLNTFDGLPLSTPGSSSEKYFAQTFNGKQMIGSTYRKSHYVQYADDNFTTLIDRTPEEEHLGILGPIIRAEVGDTVRIMLKNSVFHPVSIFLQGTSVTEDQNGIWLKNPTDPSRGTGHIVAPGSSSTFEFTIPWSVAPDYDDPDCLTYIYYSNYDMERDVSSGLIGPLLICRPGTLDSTTGKQKYVDRELFLYVSSIDENFSWHLDDNILTYINATVDADDEDFVESNVMRALNGYSYGNLPGLRICKNENIVWHILSFGQTEGNHGVTFNGNNVIIDGNFKDSHVIISGQAFSALMKPDNIGNWTVFCHNTYHYEAGMTALYEVYTCGDDTDNFYQTSGKVRRYYIAAVERKWDYSPRTIEPLTGANYSDPNHPQHSRVQKDGLYVGSVYTKALYREFTDETFTADKPITKDDIHLGVLGPFIKAEVGDTVEIVFKNMASRPYSIHAQGLHYNKTYEGMKYEDGQQANAGDAVQPGTTFTYRWEVPATSGPSAHGHNCVNFLYHSAVNPVKDMYSGLAGPIVVCRKGTLDDNMERTDSVEKEFAVMFLAFNENESWYIDRNIQENCPDADTSTDEFEESNKYDSINGRIYDNVDGLVANRGDNIAWYVIGLGENEDIHTVHFHGHTYTYRTGRTHEGDVIEVFPGTYETVEMFANNPGTWLLHCHVSEHMHDGMVATYTIL